MRGVVDLDVDFALFSVGGLSGLSDPLWMVADIGGEISMFLLFGLYCGGGVYGGDSAEPLELLKVKQRCIYEFLYLYF